MQMQATAISTLSSVDSYSNQPSKCTSNPVTLTQTNKSTHPMNKYSDQITINPDHHHNHLTQDMYQEEHLQ